MQVILGDLEKELRDVIRERLGVDCEKLYLEFLHNLKEELADERENSDDWETISDGYYNAMMSAKNDLEEILSKPKLNRKRIELVLKDLDNYL